MDDKDSRNKSRSTEAELREYVERELDRTVRTDRPELKIVFQDSSFAPRAPLAQRLWWTINSPEMDISDTLLARHYVLEARLDERQFVIWFGGLWGFQGVSPRDVMQPAIHTPFPWTVDERPWPPWLYEGDWPPEEYSLGAVLRWILQHEVTPETVLWDPMVYPMSGCRY